jgi:hypothetical protein
MFLHSVFHSDCIPIQDISELFPFILTKNKIMEWNMIKTTDVLVETTTKKNIIPVSNEICVSIIPENIYVHTIITDETSIHHKLEKQTIYVSSVQDHLFWTIFLAKYGYSEYNRHKYNYGKIEMQEKQKIVDFIHSKKPQEISEVSNIKVQRSLWNEIISDLITCPKMNYSGLIGMTFYYQCNIIIVDIINTAHTNGYKDVST